LRPAQRKASVNRHDRPPHAGDVRSNASSNDLKTRELSVHSRTPTDPGLFSLSRPWQTDANGLAARPCSARRYAIEFQFEVSKLGLHLAVMKGGESLLRSCSSGLVVNMFPEVTVFAISVSTSRPIASGLARRAPLRLPVVCRKGPAPTCSSGARSRDRRNSPERWLEALHFAEIKLSSQNARTKHFGIHAEPRTAVDRTAAVTVSNGSSGSPTLGNRNNSTCRKQAVATAAQARLPESSRIICPAPPTGAVRAQASISRASKPAHCRAARVLRASMSSLSDDAPERRHIRLGMGIHSTVIEDRFQRSVRKQATRAWPLLIRIGTQVPGVSTSHRHANCVLRGMTTPEPDTSATPICFSHHNSRETAQSVGSFRWIFL